MCVFRELSESDDLGVKTGASKFVPVPDAGAASMFTGTGPLVFVEISLLDSVELVWGPA
jgi:hypothetical protein